jgi:hypothetical protein
VHYIKIDYDEICVSVPWRENIDDDEITLFNHQQYEKGN